MPPENQQAGGAAPPLETPPQSPLTLTAEDVSKLVATEVAKAFKGQQRRTPTAPKADPAQPSLIDDIDEPASGTADNRTRLQLKALIAKQEDLSKQLEAERNQAKAEKRQSRVNSAIEEWVTEKGGFASPLSRRAAIMAVSEAIIELEDGSLGGANGETLQELINARLAGETTLFKPRAVSGSGASSGQSSGNRFDPLKFNPSTATPAEREAMKLYILSLGR